MEGVDGVIERFALTPDYEISRVIKGGWQLSDGHSDEVSSDPVSDMLAFVERGINTFDCADIYTGVEELIGRFMLANRERKAPGPVKVHTKYVPDFDELAGLTKARTEEIIDRSLSRLRQERLDMVQFHWWNYDVPGCVETAGWLAELQQAGKIDLVSTTNFNADKTREILDAGVRLATTQVQYSLLDPRAEKALVPLCAQHGMHLLCYGTLAGGFLSERWLGKAEPDVDAIENRSLRKYLLMIEEAGGWELFQELLETLHAIAKRRETTLSTIASRWVLDQPRVAAVIIGARNANHLERYGDLFRVALDDADITAINAVKGRMHTPPGDVFDLERDKDGKHGRIMKYNLNTE